jgi:hypothetical protein
MPPVSVTMQPTTLPDAAAPVLPAPAAVLDVAADADDDVVVDAGALDELLPHAAISKLAAAAAALAINAVFFTDSSPGPGCTAAQAWRAAPNPGCRKISSRLGPLGRHSPGIRPRRCRTAIIGPRLSCTRLTELMRSSKNAIWCFYTKNRIP